MGQLAFTFLFAGALVLFSCGSSGEEATNKASLDTTKTDTSMAAKDTLPHLPPPADPAPAPGTVQVKGKVLSVKINDDKQSGTFKFNVSGVLAYGSSTPVIAPQDTLWIITSKLFKSLKAGEEFIAGLTEHRVLAKFRDSTPKWRLLDLEKIKPTNK